MWLKIPILLSLGAQWDLIVVQQFMPWFRANRDQSSDGPEQMPSLFGYWQPVAGTDLLRTNLPIKGGFTYRFDIERDSWTYGG